jgi:hypothetical protein
VPWSERVVLQTNRDDMWSALSRTIITLCRGRQQKRSPILKNDATNSPTSLQTMPPAQVTGERSALFINNKFHLRKLLYKLAFDIKSHLSYLHTFIQFWLNLRVIYETGWYRYCRDICTVSRVSIWYANYIDVRMSWFCKTSTRFIFLCLHVLTESLN